MNYPKLALLAAKENNLSFDQFRSHYGENGQSDINRLEYYALMKCPRFNHERTNADVSKFINGLRRVPISVFNDLIGNNEESACTKALRQLNAALKQYDDLQSQFQNHYTKWLGIQKDIMEKLEEKQVPFEKLFDLRFYYDVPGYENGNTYEKYLIAKAKYPDKKINIHKDLFKGTDYVHERAFIVMGLSPLYYRIIFDDGFEIVRFAPLPEYQTSQLRFIEATKPVAPSPFHFEQFVCQECRNVVDLKDVKSIEDSKFQQYLQCVMNIDQKPIGPTPPPAPTPPSPPPIPPSEQKGPTPPTPQKKEEDPSEQKGSFLKKYSTEIMIAVGTGVLVELLLR